MSLISTFRRHHVRALVLLVLAPAAALAGACGGDDGDGAGRADGDRLAVVASFYPLEEAARRIAGDRADVSGLTPPGAGPHDLELDAAGAAAIETAGLVVYLGSGFQPAVEQAVASLPVEARVNLLEGQTLRGIDAPVEGVVGEVDGEVIGDGEDPHVWVDPARFIALAEGIRDALVAADPDGAEAYRANAETYLAELRALDAEFEKGLGECATRTLVTSHAAFGYLADRYGLKQAPIAGISPEDEPDPRSLAAVARLAKADGVRTVFFETLVPPDLAETVADEIGAATDALDPVEGIPQEGLDAGATYASIQRANLAALVKGLGCTG